MYEIKKEKKEGKEEEEKEEEKEEEEKVSQLISKPDEIVYQEPVLASCQFIPQMIVEQQQATVFTNALAGAVIYDGILHKEEGWCSIS